jgi:flagellar biosynthetic protein FliR
VTPELQQGLQGLLGDVGQHQVVGFMLVLARIAPLFMFAPLFSSKMVPPRVKSIVAVALAIGLTPVAMGHGAPPIGALEIFSLVLKELLIGTAFAFTIGLLFHALQIAGSFLDTLIGFAFGASIDPLTGNQGTVLSQIYGLVGLTIFVAINGDQMLLLGLGRTYELVPLLEFPDLNALITGVWQAFTSIFASALQVAAPVVLAMILTDAAFGLVTRVVPQMNVFSVGMPAKVLVGIVLIGATLPFVGGFLEDELEASVRAALGSLGVS